MHLKVCDLDFWHNLLCFCLFATGPSGWSCCRWELSAWQSTLAGHTVIIQTICWTQDRPTWKPMIKIWTCKLLWQVDSKRDTYVRKMLSFHSLLPFSSDIPFSAIWFFVVLPFWSAAVVLVILAYPGKYFSIRLFSFPNYSMFDLFFCHKNKIGCPHTALHPFTRVS